MPILGKLKAFLDENGVRYSLHDHPQTFTASATAAAEHVSRAEMAKVVVLRQERKFLMAVLPASWMIDLGTLRRATGMHDLHLATEDEFVSLFPGCEPGAMPPFGNLFGLAVWVDESLARTGEIVFNAGTHSQAVHMAYDDFARLVQPRVASFHREPE
jgi:Ala-tRNA(Pro) deacylase